MSLRVCILLIILCSSFFNPLALIIYTFLPCCTRLLLLVEPLVMDTYGGRTYEYRAPRDWDDPSGRVVSQRRGSDTEYDVRTPRQHHPDARPKPSYYGRDFQSVEQGISSSYTGPRHPFENPSVWEKRPDPYTSTVKKDYEYYKYDRVPARNVASTSYSSAKRAGRQPPQTNSDYHAKLRDLSSEVMLRANE